ncbi:MAG: DEAD/DEAH box helicase [Promethearchaeota archaeon]
MEDVFPAYFSAPYLKKNRITFRQYQKNIADKCENKNSLVVLPTGLGKTVVGILLVSRSLQKYEKGKILIMAPTRPLAFQHEESLKYFLDINEKRITTLTGKIPPEKRILGFHASQIIVSTPQVIKNDLERSRYDLKEVCLVIFDEAHRTRKNYAYNFVSSEYIKGGCSDPVILALTASPGKDKEHIQAICNNLFIENVVFKTKENDDIKQYINDVEEILEVVDLPIGVLEICNVWDHLFNRFLRFFIERGLINPAKNYYSKMDFLRISSDLTLSLQSSVSFEDLNSLNLFYRSPTILEIVRKKKLNIQAIFSYCSSCISVLHAKDLLETQDISLFVSFLEKIQFKAENGVKSAERIVNSKHFKVINSIIRSNGFLALSHPKIERTASIIEKELEVFKNKKNIIFTQYRELAQLLKERLQSKFGDTITCEKFVGQQSKPNGDIGCSQGKQIEVLKRFRRGEIDVLIATSVAEEGLDIPNVDSIIFYEPVPSEIRTIQRRGRTGRFNDGRCYVLITKSTVDAPFHKVALRKEENMHNVLISPEELHLIKNIYRKKIKFSQNKNEISKRELLRNYTQKKAMENGLIARRSIEDIVSELDEFKESDYYRALKHHGITLLSEITKINPKSLKEKITKLRCKNKLPIQNKPKKYINNNVKTLINLVNTYSRNGRIGLSELEDLAEEECIVERKFYAYLNQACYMGFLRKEGKNVHFIKSFD